MPERAAHAMPFGAELRADGTARFRLWAPAESQMVLLLGERAMPMDPAGDGWFELTAPARAGNRYAYRLASGLRVPDPASRRQPEDVHGPSELVDPNAYRWRCADWRGRPWREAALYELHVGTFSPEGSFAGVEARLDHLAGLGVTAIELMPVAEFPGARNWGYDGVLPFAPDAAYGTPDELKRLIDAAHGRGLMVFLDVVYNHFGPDGNYLHLYAPGFFTERHHTPWGAAIDFGKRPVRDFFIHNALYWLQEYRFDGLRLDAVHAIIDDSAPDILTELAETVRRAVGPERQVHLVLENEKNQARRLGPTHYTAQWNDDFHNSAHALVTGESGGYYGAFAKAPHALFARALAEGFAFQGEGEDRRGEASAHLPPGAFVNFLQNHDQTGNRAFGERLAALIEPAPLRAMLALLLLAPQPPMLFMGEEWGSRQPFLFFCDFHGDLAEAVREGRRREFAHFPQFADPEARARIPDPNAPDTFRRSALDWSAPAQPEHAEWLTYVRNLLRLRREEIVPLEIGGGAGQAELPGGGLLRLRWRGERTLHLLANLSGKPATAKPPPGRAIFFTNPPAEPGFPPWSVVWSVEPA